MLSPRSTSSHNLHKSKKDTHLSASSVTADSNDGPTPAYHFLLDIVILDDVKGRKAKSISDMVTKRLTSIFSDVCSRKPVSVACIDLPLGIIKEITTMSDVQTNNYYTPIQKHVRFKEQILNLTAFLKKQHQKHNTFVIIWSTRENKWDCIG